MLSLLDHNTYKTILPGVVRLLKFKVNEKDRISYEEMLSIDLSKAKSRQTFINFFVDNYIKPHREEESRKRIKK